MSKLLSTELNKIRYVPRGEPFVMLWQGLVCSPAWRVRSINCIRLIEFLMREHMNHAGKENGRLLATYDQLVEFGIGRRMIHSTISEAEALGLITVERGGRRGYAASDLNKFTLTFLPVRNPDPQVRGHYVQAPNDWKAVDEVQAKKIVANIKAARRYKTKTTLRK